MKILLLGYSNLAKRRIIPALKKIKGLEFDIASVSAHSVKNGCRSWYRDYIKALNKSSATIVYVSLVNSLHYQFISKAISLGKHVIADKPITLNNPELVKLIKNAKKKNLLIAEALTFNYHKQFLELLKIIKKNKPITNITMKFNIPKPHKNDTKLSKKLGGGCFNDMIPYAAEINRVFLKKKINIKSFIHKNINHLSDSFSINTTNGKIEFYGHFSHNSEYENSITLSSENYLIRLDRFCAPPPNKSLFIKYQKKNILTNVKIEKDDMFLSFFIDFFKKIKKKQHNNYYKKILFNSNFKDRLQKKSM